MDWVATLNKALDYIEDNILKISLVLILPIMCIFQTLIYKDVFTR